MTRLDYMDDLKATYGIQETNDPCSLLILLVHIAM